jgi:HAD superfamily hydrolase (TIGR01484 family)
MSKYKALVFDIDGTAVDNHREALPTPRLVQAIKDARGHLELFAASGRSIPYAASVFKALGLTNPCIIGGGTMLMDPATGEVIERSLISVPTLTQIQNVLRPLGHELYFPSTAERKRTPTHWQPISEPQPYLVMTQMKHTDIPGIMLALSNVPGITGATSPDWDGDYFMQITSADATKEYRVRQVLERLGVSPVEAIGVGDADNDIHLFAAVGHRVAMANATDQLKSIADEIAPSVADDGLAHIIEMYANR